MDVTISYKDGIIFIEAKYLAPVNLRTTSDPRRERTIGTFVRNVPSQVDVLL